MNVIFLKLQVLFFLTSLLSLDVQAQNLRFIYIQTENRQPFYVKMDKSFLSSSATGYIIIPKLNEGAHYLSIGFPKNEWPELHVTLNVKDINAGFLLKNFADKGWSLVNLQTSVSTVPETQQPLNKEGVVISTVDEFARILAEVVNDPSIVQVTTKKNLAETSVTPEEINTFKSPNANELIEGIPVNPKSNDTEINKIKVVKLKQDSTSEGLLITYVDIGNTVIDTINFFIPVTQSIKIETTEKKIEMPESVFEKKKAEKRDIRFIDMELQNPNQKTDSGTIRKDDFVVVEKKTVINSMSVNEAETKAGTLDNIKMMINSDCKKTATQNDFLKLRKQMAAEVNEKNMIKSANKQFVNICYTTEQVKNLSVLFITEDEKYRFFVAAFPHVSDTHNFGTLEEQLNDNYYKVRFKAMLSH